MLTVFRGGPSELPSFHWAAGFVLAGDSGRPWAGMGEGLASWGRAFFPDGSSSEPDGGRLIPAMPPTGTRHRGSGSEVIWAHPCSGCPADAVPNTGPGAGGVRRGSSCCSGGLGGAAPATPSAHSQQGPGLTRAPPSGSESPDLGREKWDFSVSPQSGNIKAGLVLCPELFRGFLRPDEECGGRGGAELQGA